MNPEATGTKVAADYGMTVEPGATATIRLRLARDAAEPFGGFDEVFDARLAEADAFYAGLAPSGASEDERNVMRQALAGMLWTKQYYEFDVGRWLAERGNGEGLRNAGWAHMRNHDVISMPDKWEYPWYAVWDLAFHAFPLALVDLDFAKHQLALFLEDRYQHPDGQIPAYEWNFSDVNPPVHAWATLVMYRLEKERRGAGDVAFLARAFESLCRNFRWWVERKGPAGMNVFEGGFLGLDNIGVFNRERRSCRYTGERLEQADGTAWMAFYCSQHMFCASPWSSPGMTEKAARTAVLEDMATEVFSSTSPQID